MASSFNPRPALARGATARQSARASRLLVSIRAPRLRAGRLRAVGTAVIECMFQSAPRACARGDLANRAVLLVPRRFNPRPALARGATPRHAARRPRQPVSIRAPRLRAGRLQILLECGADLGFQSAPRACARGDANLDTLRRHLLAFQSAPRACARGDRCTKHDRLRKRRFQSAPRACARGDWVLDTGDEYSPCFNPRPALARGATPGHQRARRGQISFNPRPALARGATRASRGRANTRSGFNPRPALARGATSRPTAMPASHCVSIRAPRLRAGRPLSAPMSPPSLRFQSAPRACARGDARPATSSPRPSRFNPRPALARGATQTTLLPLMPPWVFQSAPRACARGDLPRLRPSCAIWSFNPRPALARGATFSSRLKLGPVVFVSIRAPRLRAGRPACMGPRVESSYCFNPRPALARGATPGLACAGRQPVVSIRAPRLRAGRLSTGIAAAARATFQSAPRACARGD